MFHTFNQSISSAALSCLPTSYRIAGERQMKQPGGSESDYVVTKVTKNYVLLLLHKKIQTKMLMCCILLLYDTQYVKRRSCPKAVS